MYMVREGEAEHTTLVTWLVAHQPSNPQVADSSPAEMACNSVASTDCLRMPSPGGTLHTVFREQVFTPIKGPPGGHNQLTDWLL